MTTYHARVDGPWLRLEPSTPPPAARGIPKWLGRAVLTSAITVVVIVTAMGLRMLVVGPVDGGPSPRAAIGDDGSAVGPGAGIVPTGEVPSPDADLAASFARWSHDYGVPVALLEALTWQESRWQPHVVSEAGAVGLAQLMPATEAAIEASLGRELDPRVPDDAVRMSAHLMATLLASAAGDLRVALAGYTQGAWSVEGHGMTPTIRQYVDEVTALYEQFRATRSARR